MRPFARAVACCSVLFMFGVVAQSLKPVKLTSQQLPTFLLSFDGTVCTSLPTLLGPPTRITDGLQSLMGCILSFPRSTAGPDIVERFFVRFHTIANTDATTPNILGPTELGVVASVCT